MEKMPDPESQPYPPTGIPKRKPVPTVATAPPPVNPLQSHSWTQWPKSKWSQLSKRQRIIFISATIGIILIALIIGLAVGLTRESHENLHLPTAHGGPYTGDLTYYDPAVGSCGITSSSSDLICAVSHVLFDAAATGSNPNANPLCGLKVRLKRGSSSVDVKIVDRCVGCAMKDLDVSPAAFKKLADMDLGRVKVEWAWLQDTPVSV
ncbi:RlpA-like double-psi beta-barrel domain-containing protein [Aspergillus alliaceus]|uniref:RlpA-like double-psi beta-barrel domain-containing protein n=1 Tax=Petromyces alliaceus TaxID=209559 RepID=UPI0012A5A0A0|nr:RlpA-like double-psi beta-barrel-protein domain-containing protein-containing protein [Aspergillus alliaceus]KAB8235777.1 RlpA-like double-psi beta-barrel-protein domain-containing protein-containing protein [Aspergillus alliaceus]